MNAVRLCLGTLTVLPLRPPSRVDRDTAGRAMLLAPLAGALLAVLAGGALWLLAGVLGYANFAPAMFGAITAVLGGLVLKGSNDSTMQQTRAALDAAEASRSELIGALSLHTVSDAPETARLLH